MRETRPAPCSSLGRDVSHRPNTNAPARGYATARGAVLRFMIQTTLEQLCEAVRLQSYTKGGQGGEEAVGRLGARTEGHPS